MGLCNLLEECLGNGWKRELKRGDWLLREERLVQGTSMCKGQMVCFILDSLLTLFVIIWLSVLFMSAHTEIGETVVSEFGANKRKKARDDNLCIPGASNWADQRIHVPGC